MDILRDNVLKSLHTIACERFGIKMEDGKSTLSVDYDKEIILFDNDEGGIHLVVNCAADSESAAVIDFCKAIVN